MISTILIVITFTAGFLVVFAANLILVDLAQNAQKKIKQRIGDQQLKQQKERARLSAQEVENLGKLAMEALSDAADKTTLHDRLKEIIEQSGMNITVRRLLVMTAMSGLFLAAIGWLAFGLWGAVPAGLFAGSIPYLIVRFKRYRRLELLRSQLSDVFDMMARVLRAGQSMPQSMQAVSQEFQPPVALEFAYCYEQQNLGLSADFALRDLARRTGLLEIKIFVLAMLVHRQSGGNLTEILENLAFIVRERFRIRGMIAALTAEGRIQAAILLAMPPIMYIVLLFVNRDYALRLFDHPILPIISLVLMGLGALWIRKIVNFDF